MGGADGGPEEDAEKNAGLWASKVRDARLSVSLVMVVWGWGGVGGVFLSREYAAHIA